MTISPKNYEIVDGLLLDVADVPFISSPLIKKLEHVLFQPEMIERYQKWIGYGKGHVFVYNCPNVYCRIEQCIRYVVPTEEEGILKITRNVTATKMQCMRFYYQKEAYYIAHPVNTSAEFIDTAALMSQLPQFNDSVDVLSKSALERVYNLPSFAHFFQTMEVDPMDSFKTELNCVVDYAYQIYLQKLPFNQSRVRMGAVTETEDKLYEDGTIANYVFHMYGLYRALLSFEKLHESGKFVIDERIVELSKEIRSKLNNYRVVSAGSHQKQPHLQVIFVSAERNRPHLQVFPNVTEAGWR